MQLGWLTFAHSPSADDDHAAIGEQMQQACLAETLGFDAVWLTEHNFTGESVYCDPIPFAAALAMKTTRVRIGFAVIQMTLRHPIRLATQLALLDNLCNGRLDVGVGRGTVFNEYEFVGYGLRSDDSRERFAESLDVLLGAWTKAPFHHDGEYFKLSVPEMRPKPVQRPHPPIWHSVVSPESFRHCGRKGVPIMTVRIPTALMVERLRLYEEGLEEAGFDAESRRKLRKQAALWRHVYVGESRAEAEDHLADSLLHTRRHMKHARDELNPKDFQFDASLLNAWTDYSKPDEEGVRFAMQTSIYGTAADVTEQMAELRRAGIHHVLCQMSFGFLSHERIVASMRRFGERVMPAIR